jgi:S-DNA-T family DNA segregation ATPase FtsK/SpoIIIE
LPEHVYLADLLPAHRREDGLLIAPVGLSVDDLAPLNVDLRDGPHFLITGPPRGGKSTLLRTWLTSLRASAPSERLRLCLADFTSDEPLAGVCPVRDDGELVAVFDEVEGVPTVLGIDDLEALQRAVSSETLDRLNQVVRARGQRGLHVILVGSTGSFGSSYDGIGHTLKTLQTGFLIGGSDYEDIQVLGINVPRPEASLGLAPGRGFYSRRKHWLRIKVAETRLTAP